MPRDHTWFLQRVAAMQTAWGLLPTTWQTALVAAISVVTGYLGWQEGAGIFWSLVGASAVFAFVMFGFFIAVLLTRTLSIFERLTVEQIGIAQCVLHQDKDGRNKKKWNMKGLTLEATIRNHSQSTIYFKLKRAQHSVGGQTVAPMLGDQSVMIIPPQTPQKITFATLPDIPLGDELKGHLELELVYGSSRDALKNLFSYESTPGFSVAIDKHGKGQIMLNCPIKKHLHEKL